ncbi:hypothetical protein Cflav_PD0151 [Pedosphaera parvula Ellin514]|uniref:Uncharacterized protein n=1 Tax=Pedosphaera parvula (strain Ellin514) TaxID=320771 RepID=B9XSQ9_PEDPL|nr:hypothetical protein Cflav_PD0151 [Pedosphaera parvula Ellin514]
MSSLTCPQAKTNQVEIIKVVKLIFTAEKIPVNKSCSLKVILCTCHYV